MRSDFERLMRGRRSVRAFTPEPVPRVTVEAICRLARLAPSGANLQPGRLHVLSGEALGGLTAALGAAIAAGEPQTSEYGYFPEPLPKILQARRRAAGYALYAALGVDKRDLEGRRRQFERNYAFFGAPVGVVATIDRKMGPGCFMDMGMSLMGFFLAAEDFGLGATGIGALAHYGPAVHRHLGLPQEEMVVCGIALGHPDRAAPVNHFRTDRADLAEYASFKGFPEP